MKFIIISPYKYINFYKILFILILLLFILKNLFKFEKTSFCNKKLLLKAINKNYNKYNQININEIESKLPNGRIWEKNKNKKMEINIGIQLDPNYVLRVMMTLASIIDSQKNETKLRFHFAVVLNFKGEDMIKIYSLRDKLRNDVEFNFYNAKRVETELENLNIKGPGAVAKLLLPDLLPDDINKILVVDTGDLLVFRDLYELYNWNMSNYLYLGQPGKGIGKFALIKKKRFITYINTGVYLINVTMAKKENIYELYLKYKNIYHSVVGDQDLLNDIGYGKIGYFPIKFGFRAPYRNDKESDKLLLTENPYHTYFRKYPKKIFPFIPKKEGDFIQLGYNPVIVHQFNGKWMFGKGMTIYRRLAQYYIKMAGIWDEMCQKFPGYCSK